MGTVGGKAPSAAVKFEPCSPPKMTTLRIVANGMPTFHHVAVLFVRASARMPRKFTDETSAISTTATTRPLWVGKPCELIQPPANE